MLAPLGVRGVRSPVMFACAVQGEWAVLESVQYAPCQPVGPGCHRAAGAPTRRILDTGLAGLEDALAYTTPDGRLVLVVHGPTAFGIYDARTLEQL